MAAEKLRCNQCWLPKPLASFRKGGRLLQDCADCREGRRSAEKARRSGARRRRRGLSTRVHSRVIWSEATANRKLGPIPSTIVAAGTCPKSCPFYGRGCYGEAGHLGSHWKRAAIEGLTWKQVLKKIAALPRGMLWRWAVVGDLPGQGERLDVLKLRQLVEASEASGARGFTFTHKPLTTETELQEVNRANAPDPLCKQRRGSFTINLSANSPSHADELAALEIGPVAVTLPSGYPDTGGKTPNGRPIVVCLNETNGLTCAECQLCSMPSRKSIVGFRAHGQGKKLVEQQIAADQLRRTA